MKLLILEDEPVAADRLKQSASTIINDVEIHCVQSVEEGRKLLNTVKDYSLMISDIQLADGMSFELFREFELDIPIIFTTAYNEYAIDAFDFNGIAYILKPINDEKLRAAIEKALSQTSQLEFTKQMQEQLMNSMQLSAKTASYKKRFISKYGNRMIIRQVDEIALFYTENKISYMIERSGNGKFMINHNMDELENELLDPSQFYRINRSAIVNLEALDEIRNFDHGRLLLKLPQFTEKELIVSRDRVPQFKDWINQ